MYACVECKIALYAGEHRLRAIVGSNSMQCLLIFSVYTNSMIILCCMSLIAYIAQHKKPGWWLLAFLHSVECYRMTSMPEWNVKCIMCSLLILNADPIQLCANVLMPSVYTERILLPSISMCVEE